MGPRRDFPTPNVDNVLPGMLEQIRAQRERDAAAPAHAEAAQPQSRRDDAGQGPVSPSTDQQVRELRAQMRGVHALLVLVLVALVVVLFKVFG